MTESAGATTANALVPTTGPTKTTARGGATMTTTIDTNNSIPPHAAKENQPTTSFEPGTSVTDP